MDNNELMHHGVKGMKWGVRRYQRPDGSLTPDGKRRARVYRDKELQSVNKKHDTSRIQKRNIRNMAAYEKNPTARLRKKIVDGAETEFIREGMRWAESSSLRNMALKELMKEMNEVKAIKAANVVGVVGAATMASLCGFGYVKLNNVDLYKTNKRVPLEKQRAIAETARYEARRVGDTLPNRRFER